MPMNVYNAVKSSITTRQAAERYGLTVNRKGMCKCPFHQDKNPSMKVDKRFHCFGCQADGDVIEFTSRLFGFNKKAAALKLASDFGIRYNERAAYVPAARRSVSEEEKTEHQAAHFFRELADYRNHLIDWKTEYAPTQPDEAFHPRFAEALTKLPQVENDLDILLSDDLSSKRMLISELMLKEKEVKPMNGTDLVPVYYESPVYAREHKEIEQFRESHFENVNCRRAIEASISKHFDGMRLSKQAVDEVLDKYGAERVALVLAATVQLKSWDGRFSQANKDWAFTVRMPDTQSTMNYDRRDAYAVTSHPAVLDGFISHARKVIQERHSVRDELNQPVVQASKPSIKHDGPER